LLNIRAIDPTQLNPRLVRKLADAAERNDAPAVRLLLLAGWPADAVGTHGATALHFGAWHGNAELVRETVAHGSPFEARDRDFSMTPLGWAFHGSLHGWNRDRGDYAATVRALLTAGAVVPGAAESVAASDAVRNVLRDWQNHRGGEVLPRAR
jgi:ankyrin repeat protein